MPMQTMVNTPTMMRHRRTTIIKDMRELIVMPFTIRFQYTQRQIPQQRNGRAPVALPTELDLHRQSHQSLQHLLRAKRQKKTRVEQGFPPVTHTKTGIPQKNQ